MLGNVGNSGVGFRGYRILQLPPKENWTKRDPSGSFNGLSPDLQKNVVAVNMVKRQVPEISISNPTINNADIYTPDELPVVVALWDDENGNHGSQWKKVVDSPDKKAAFLKGLGGW